MAKINGEVLKNTHPGSWVNRILIATPSTGLVRMEWVMARYGQIIPTNWSAIDMIQWISAYAPMYYQVADAQNLCVRKAIEEKVEWLLFIEHDNVLPPDAFVRINDYMRKATVPVVSSLYFTKGHPTEPLLYRQQGRSYYDKWKMGDKVWVSGIPMGCTLIHGSILQAMWDDSPEYKVAEQITRRVFQTPEQVWYDPKIHPGANFETGTSDLAWCKRVMDEKYFEKAGWPQFQKKEFPFLVDTNLFVKHIDPNGVQWPIDIPEQFVK